MELFSKVYNCYYQVVEEILEQSRNNPVNRQMMQDISETYGFQESGVMILSKLMSGEWALMQEGENGYFTAVTKHSVKIPFTSLQKAWIKALLGDRRLRLFIEETEYRKLECALEGVEPLYNLEDFHYFDRYQDGDPYEDDWYQENFRAIFYGVIYEQPYRISYCAPNKKEIEVDFMPCRFQYSAKNDKFRVFGVQIIKQKYTRVITINISRIVKTVRCAYSMPETYDMDAALQERKVKEPAVIEISGLRNSLERCMLHFANYEKQTVYDRERDLYICSIYYDVLDETELLIQVLSFGTVIKVVGSERFLGLVKSRVKRQYELLNGTIGDYEI